MQKGFSLIELMIVLTVIGILAAVAVPSYSSYLVRAKRTECRTALFQTMQQQERYYTQKNTYAAYLSTDTVNLRTFSGDTLSGSVCKISSEICATGVALSSCVLVRGTPNYVDAEVNQITLRSDGVKSCTGTNSEKCWN
jgi:type IV pilus assembly protein PilE